jgi:hypothetical protein
MPQVANPRKSFNFRVFMAGLDQFEVQKAYLMEIQTTMLKPQDGLK